MKKRIMSVFIVLALVVTFCASCGDGSGDGPKLVYWSMWGEAEPQGQVISEAAEAFEDMTGIAVEITFTARDSRKTLEPALASGEVVDIFDEDVDRVMKNWGSYLLNLDDYVNGVYEDTDGQPYRSLINGTLMDLVEDYGNGSVYQIPYQPFLFAVMYNKDLFAQAGVTTTPKTWDEFLDVCAQLKAAGITPITVDDAYMGCLFGYTLDRIVGSEKVAEMVANLDFSDPGVLRACEIWEEMVKKGYISVNAATNVWPAGQNEEFAQNSVAMYLNGTWLPNEIKAMTEEFNWGTFAWPAIDAAGDGIEANNFAAQCFAINKDTKYPDEAFAFIRFLTLGEYDQKLANESIGVPVANDAVWPEQLADAKVVLDNSSKRLDWAVGMEDVPELNAAIKDGLAKLILGEYDAQQFADSLAAL